MLGLPLTKQPGKGNAFVEFLTDSPEQIAYLVELLCPRIKDIGITRLGIHPSLRESH